ncbi:MAG: peptidase S8/S53 domain-containing protein [Monoraphidium minutum]|nr:MAG: peptidase S8/S53 domain-containing protein [Monoraphidium minutum]
MGALRSGRGARVRGQHVTGVLALLLAQPLLLASCHAALPSAAPRGVADAASPAARAQTADSAAAQQWRPKRAALLGPVARGYRPQLPALADDEAAPLVLLFKEARHLDLLRRGACAALAALAAPAPAGVGFTGAAAPAARPAGLRFFGRALRGAAGRFTGRQLAALRGCLPEGALLHAEVDQQVRTAEGPALPEPGHVSKAESGGASPSQTQVALDDQPPPDASGGGADDAAVAGAWGPFSAPRLPWSLDRLDQRGLPLDGAYNRPAGASGAGVTIYAIDSGINPAHREFGGRAAKGPNFLEWVLDPPPGAASNDCDGHGSHVASTAVGGSVGVAPGAAVVALKVLDCAGEGSISDVVEALDWVAANARRPAVVTLSLGVPAGNYSRALEEAVRGVVRSGVTAIVASGNSQADACTIAPASVEEAITVAASNAPARVRGGMIEDLYTWGNTGACVDVLAPGVDIYAACASDARCGRATDESYAWASGTSMAVPHVAGWAALFLERRPGAAPAEVKAALLRSATRGALDLRGALGGTPNLLAYAPGAAAGGGAEGSQGGEAVAFEG